MKPNLIYENTIEEMKLDVARLQTQADKNIKPTLKEIGKEVSEHVKRYAPVSEKIGKEYVHIKDDVVYKVKKSRKMGENYVSISGGKKTGAKWHLVNDGHLAPNGDFVPGNHFVDKAEVMSEQSIEYIVDEFLGRVLDE